MAKLVNASEYAQMIGVAPNNVLKAINQGRITAKKVKNVWRIDPDKANKEWAANTDHGHPSAAKIPDQPSVEKTGGVPPYGTSRAIKEAYAARLKKLEYEREMNSLVLKDDIDREWARLGVSIREKMLAIPSRLSGQLSGIDDPREIKRILTDEIKVALTELAEAV